MNEIVLGFLCLCLSLACTASELNLFHVIQITGQAHFRIRNTRIVTPSCQGHYGLGEGIHRRAARLALGQKQREMNYEDRCKMLNWPTLEKCRKCLSFVDWYKTVFERNGLLFKDIFEYSKVKSTRANYNYKLHVKLARIVKPWNSIVEAGNIALFKTRLKSYMDIPWPNSWITYQG